MALTPPPQYDLVVDELPVRLIPLGAVEEESNKIVVFSTLHLLFMHDGSHIIEADVEVDDGIELVADQPADFSVHYIVKWEKTDAPLSVSPRPQHERWTPGACDGSGRECLPVPRRKSHLLSRLST